VTDLHLAAALDGAGWHPAAWRDPAARPRELFSGRYWAEVVQEAERGLLDFVTIEDALGPPPGDRADRVRGRLDAMLLAARVAPLTSNIGLVPATSTTHTEPFHVAIGVASLDFASRGRAGWRPQISARPSEAAHFGRRTLPEDPDELAAELLGEAADAVEVVRRLWDSWEDDAEIRDVATGRFVDRDRLHYIDFEGAHFSVRGPSITPRPPQGQPLVIALAHGDRAYEFAAGGADLVLLTPRSRDDAVSILEQVRAAERAARRTRDRLKVFADLVVFLDAEPGAAAVRKDRLDVLDGEALASDTEIFTGTPGELADLLLDLHGAGLDGFRLRPGVLPYDLTGITRGLVPELKRRNVFRTGYETSTLRGLLGLPRPASRYARAS
jgi:alkanesulfonate monooxygenase SsuD/methylene tetrahydromethanopterin reductase-like flavin-dependent oxidoreductase (luciferase family)